MIEVKPKAGVESSYDKIRLTVDKQHYTIRQADYFDGAKVVKRLEASDFTQLAPQAYRAGRLVMRDLEEDRQTTLLITDRETGEAIRDALFTERQLKRGVR